MGKMKCNPGKVFNIGRKPYTIKKTTFLHDYDLPMPLPEDCDSTLPLKDPNFTDFL